MVTDSLEDHELVTRYIDGDSSCIETLITRHKDRVFTYIFMMVKKRDLAEDIFQDTFIKVIKSLKSGVYKERGIFCSWVVRIAHNLIIDHFRKEKRLSLVSVDDENNVSAVIEGLATPDLSVEDALIAQRTQEQVKQLIEQLPYHQKQVVLLRHYAKMSFKEIAEQTDVSINTALGRMRYALINMKQIMDKQQILQNE